MAAQTGSTVEQGKFKVRKPEIVVVKSNKATLTGTPVGTAGAEIGYAYIKNPSGSLGKSYEQNATADATGQFTYSEKELTFFAGDIPDGTEIAVFYDEEVTAAKNRHKYLLQYHLIFVCKYRKKLFLNQNISDDIKQFSYDICRRHNVIIHEMETDKDHIHYMIETEPNINLSDLVRTMKSYTTYHIWKYYKNYLSKHFWKENTFFTDGYFLCSVGNVSKKQLRKYIENQG